jgi:outer membrane protein, heavy metal efflux system
VFTQRISVPAAALVVLLAGCAGLPADLGRSDVAGLVEARGRTAPTADESARSRLIADLTARPLTTDAAVRIALTNNPRLKAEYARLGIAAAEVYDAGRLSNPTLSAAWLSSDESGAADQVSFGLSQSFTDILLLSARNRLARGEFERSKQAVGGEIQRLAAETEAAYYRLVGAKQVSAMRAAIAEAADVSARLAQRFFDAGNISRLELAQEQAAASEARLALLEAEARAVEARAGLNTLLGFTDGEFKWDVTERLPMPVAQEDELPALQSLAEKNRLDLSAARAEVDLLADSLGVTRRYRWLGLLEVGVETERETDRSRITGPTLALQLPLFNQGRGAVTRAESLLQQAEAGYHTRRIEASNAVQLAYAELLNARARAEHYRRSLIPQREAIVQRTLEEVNYMLKGQFELLFAKRQEYDAYQGYLEAVRDYWLARVELAKQVGTRLPSDAQIGPSSVDVETLITPKPAGMEHGGMPMEGMDHSGHTMPAEPKEQKPTEGDSGESHHH